MSRKKIIILIVIAIVSLPASLYTFMGVIYYTWLEASQQWPTEKAAIWVMGLLVLGLFFFITFIVCVVKVVKGMGAHYRAKRSSIESDC